MFLYLIVGHLQDLINKWENGSNIGMKDKEDMINILKLEMICPNILVEQ
jgi:hypothetical protein